VLKCASVDGDYLQAALEGKIKITEQLPKLLQADTTAYILSHGAICLSVCLSVLSFPLTDHLTCHQVHRPRVEAEEPLLCGGRDDWGEFKVPSVSEYVCVWV